MTQNRNTVNPIQYGGGGGGGGALWHPIDFSYAASKRIFSREMKL